MQKMKEGFLLLKKNVLRDKKDFNSIYNKGKSVGDKYIVLFYKKNQLAFNRTAFLASKKKVGNSVKRNRARRWMKEAYRGFSQDVSCGYDFIMIARNTINETSFFYVEKSMKTAFKRANLMLNKK